MGLRPFWHYYGSKWALSRYYPDPLHDTIIEPFAGSAGYAMRHHTCRAILIDKNPDITDLWRFLIRASSEEVRSIPIIPVGSDVREANLPREWELLVSWNISIAAGHRQYIRTKWGETNGSPTASWTEEKRERVAIQVEKIRHWEVIEGSYEDAPDIEATWFVDPPYVQGGHRYPHHDIDREDLARWCRSRRGALIVCEGDGGDWLPFEPLRQMRTMRRTTRTELVYFQGFPHGTAFMRSPLQGSLFEQGS